MAIQSAQESYPCLQIDRPVLQGIEKFSQHLERHNDYFGRHFTGLLRQPHFPVIDYRTVDAEAAATFYETTYKDNLQINRPEEDRLVLYRQILSPTSDDGIRLVSMVSSLLEASFMRELSGVSVSHGFDPERVNVVFDRSIFSSDAVGGRVLLLLAKEEGKEGQLLRNQAEICEQAMPSTVGLQPELSAHVVPSVPVARLDCTATEANEQRFCDIVSEWLPVRLSLGRLAINIKQEVSTAAIE